MSMNALQHAMRAINIMKSLGTRRAAGFLRNRGVTLDEALHILVGRPLGRVR